MKKFLILLIFLSCCTTPQSTSNEYYETVIGHIVQNIISGDCNAKCINSIVSSDLKYATYNQAMFVLDGVNKKLPNIFKGIKKELSIQIERKYKKSVMK